MSLIDHLKREILKTGYPLEIEVSSLLDNKWDVINTDTYVDKDEGKTRDIDINATRYTLTQNDVDFTVNLTIECKKSDKHAWIFFTRPYEKNYMDINGQYLDAEQRFLQNIGTITLMKLILEPSALHYWNLKQVAVCFSEFPIQGKQEDHHLKQIFEAQNQIKKYIVDKKSVNMSDEGYPFFIDFHFPCIVFDGKMFEAEVNKDQINRFCSIKVHEFLI